MKKSVVLVSLLILICGCTSNKEVPNNENEGHGPNGNVVDDNFGKRFIMQNEDGSDAYALTVTKLEIRDWDGDGYDQAFTVWYTLENIDYNFEGEEGLFGVVFSAHDAKGITLRFTKENTFGSEDNPKLLAHGQSMDGEVNFRYSDKSAEGALTVEHFNEAAGPSDLPVFSIVFAYE